MEILQVDFSNKRHCTDLVTVLNAYALDPMGGGVELTSEVKEKLCTAMSKVPGALAFLVYEGEQAIGLCNCFPGFSTFTARPLLNIHDICVLPEVRGKGVGQALLRHVADFAKKAGYIKITLEVRADNAAQHLYEREGYKNNDGVEMRFLSKKL